MMDDRCGRRNEALIKGLYEETESDETLKEKDDLQVFGQTKPPVMGHRVLLQCIVTFAKI